MAMLFEKKNYSHANSSFEGIGKAIKWLKWHGNKKIAIMGMSNAGMYAFAAATYFSDITMKNISPSIVYRACIV